MEWWTRREALRLGGVALGALVLGRRSRADVVLGARSAGVAYELAAGPARVLAGGQSATLWTYNGSFPGPLLRVREGERVRIRLTNRLGEPTNLHFHGLHIPPDVDDPFLEVPPGGSTLYEFTVPYGSAGTYWRRVSLTMHLDCLPAHLHPPLDTRVPGTVLEERSGADPPPSSSWSLWPNSPWSLLANQGSFMGWR